MRHAMRIAKRLDAAARVFEWQSLHWARWWRAGSPEYRLSLLVRRRMLANLIGGVGHSGCVDFTQQVGYLSLRPWLTTVSSRSGSSTIPSKRSGKQSTPRKI